MARNRTGTSDFTDTAHDVWLAGLGALAAAGDEGEKLFRTLVARGKKAEKQVVRPLDEAGSRLRSTVRQVQTRASKSLGSIQATIDDSVAAALHSLGVPTRTEIAALNRKVGRLAKAVNGRSAPKTKARAKRKTTKRRTVKRAAS